MTKKLKSTSKELEEVIVECKCHDLAHRIRFTYDNDENDWYCEVVATGGIPFYQRVIVAIKYIFKIDIIEYAEVIMNTEQTQLLARTIVLKDMAVLAKEK